MLFRFLVVIVATAVFATSTVLGLIPQSAPTGGQTYALVAKSGSDDNVTDEEGVKVSFGWSIYVRFSKKTVKEMKAQQLIYSVGLLSAAVCGYLPPGLREACAVQFGLGYYALDKTFDKAADESKCVEVKFDYTGGFDGWRRYSCVGSLNTGQVPKPK